MSKFGSFARGISKGINSLAENRNRRSENELNQLAKLAELDQAGYSVSGNSLSRSADALTAPEGFVRVGGKVVQDPTYYNPQKEREKARIKSEEEANAYSRLSGFSGQNSALEEIRRLEEELASMPDEDEVQDDDDDGEADVMTDPLELEARQAIASGADPKAVMERLNKLRGKS